MKKYLLYYAGFNQDKAEEQIGVASSVDMNEWNYAGDRPAVALGSQGSSDKSQTSNPCVIKHDGIYKMWYQGKSLEGAISICYAESTDGISWKSNDKAVLSPKISPAMEYREGFHHPHVIFDEESNTFKMWCVVYHKGLTSIGFCDSVNGLVWTEMQMTNMVSRESNLKYFYPFIMKDKNIYKMWFTERVSDKSWTVNFAESKDGLSWEIYKNNPVIAPAYPSMVSKIFEALAKFMRIYWELPVYGIGSPFVWKEGNNYMLIGHEVGPRGKLYIPLYESLDGLVWKKIKNNILPPGNSVWNKFFQADPYIYVEQ